MNGDTALTAGLSDDPEEWAKRDAERRRVDELMPRVRVFAYEIFFDAYVSGACDFESLMRSAHRAVRTLPPIEQRRIMGTLALAACDAAVIPRASRGRPAVSQALCDLARGLVDLVREREALPTKANARGEKTCYERVAELLAEFGVINSAKTIEAWARGASPRKSE